MIFLVGAAAGIGASWLLDVGKAFVTIPSKYKGPVFAGLTAVVLGLYVVLLQAGSIDGRFLAAAFLLALGEGKLLHSVTSRLQASKDRDRYEVLSKLTGRR